MLLRLADLALVLALALAATGCGLSRHAMPFGSNDPGRLDRANAAASRLLASATLDIRLEHRDGLGAWAWPNGRVRLTPTLIDALDDDELAAVLAHELGHMGNATATPAAVMGNATAPPAAVAGDGRSLAVEIAADAAGCALLAARGIPPGAMVRLLERLATAHLDVDVRIAAASRACR